MRPLLVAIATLTLAFAPIQTSAKEIILSKDNTLVLNDAVTPASVSKVMEQASALNATLKSGYPAYLFLYTPGGYIQEGLELIEFLKGLNRPVHTVALFAASMGWQIQQHLGTRYVMQYSVTMSHRARGGFQGEFGGGLSQLDARYGLWLRRIDLMDQITVDRTNGKQTLKSYRNAYANELWLNGPEAVQQGYADELVIVKCDASLSGTNEELIDFGFFKIIAVFSECPLKTAPLQIKAALFTNQGEMLLSEFLQKGGKFGGSCGKKTVVVPSLFRDDTVTETVEQKELCAQDETLTLDTINKAKKEKEQEYTQDLKNKIHYSY